jgi:hypothetical protein
MNSLEMQVDTSTAIKTTATAIGTAVAATVLQQHPLQYMTWMISILAGMLAITYWVMKIRALRNEKR